MSDSKNTSSMTDANFPSDVLKSDQLTMVDAEGNTTTMTNSRTFT